jgi:hypothetical protein
MKKLITTLFMLFILQGTSGVYFLHTDTEYVETKVAGVVPIVFTAAYIPYGDDFYTNYVK